MQNALMMSLPGNNDNTICGTTLEDKEEMLTAAKVLNVGNETHQNFTLKIE